MNAMSEVGEQDKVANNVEDDLSERNMTSCVAPEGHSGDSNTNKKILCHCYCLSGLAGLLQRMSLRHAAKPDNDRNHYCPSINTTTLLNTHFIL